jgi:hypothetical protein
MPGLLRQITEVIDSNFNDLDYHLSCRIKDLFSTLNKVEIVEDEAYERIKSEFVEMCIEAVHPESEAEAEKYREGLFIALNSEENNEAKKEFEEFFTTFSFEENPFNRIRDFLAFRIIIEDEGIGDKIDELYEMANLIIRLVNEDTTFDVVKSMPLTKTGPLKNESPLIFVPKESGLKPEYVQFAKDYVANPKADGYQSLHIVLYDPFTRQYIELQLRTRSMHIIAQTDAKHENYKEKKYGHKQQEVADNIDFSQIHLANQHFRYYKYVDSVTGEENEHIYDTAGITKPFTFDLHTLGKLKRFIASW